MVDTNLEKRQSNIDFPMMPMEDTVSNGISSKRSGGNTKADVGDKKKLKVLKQALKDERSQKQTLNEEIKTLTTRNKELQKEYEQLDTKYLSLYDENDRLQEYLQALQYKLQNGIASKVSHLRL